LSVSAGDSENRRSVALLPWGNLVEDFLDRIGLSLEDYCERMTGGWGFGYVEALRSARWRPVIFLVSRRFEATTRLVHAPTGARICVLPAWRAYRRIIRRMSDPYGDSVERVFGRVSRLRRPGCFAYKEIAPYLATPLGALARNLRREGCAAILTQEYEYARFDMCVLLGKLLRLPVYATFQGGDRPVGWLAHLVRPAALRAARGLVIGAGGEAQRVLERYGISEDKIWRIPNPLDLDLWRPIDRDKARQALGLPVDSRIVIYHGRIEMHRKGLDVLLDAWERIRARRTAEDERLLLVGSGHDDAVLRERLSRLELSTIQWIDRYELDREAMRRYLSAADLYVLPSRIEGFPVAPLEAMACGLPVVGSDIPAMLEIIARGHDSGGLVVPREDPAALAEAIAGLLDRPGLCRTLGRCARRNVEERFSIESVGRQLDQMLSRGLTAFDRRH
jgi:glycosyltransferase involved in cell wall biosynthesis